jgi:sugar lactone lactonase YvrE
MLAIVARSAEKLSASRQSASTAQATISSISPAQGPIAGGTQITLTGSGFTGTTVTSDGAIITPQSRSDTQITFVTPPRDNGIASVKLSGNGPNVYAEFLYLPPSLKDLPPGYITTVMGIGRFRGDGRVATNAQLDAAAAGVVLGTDGSIYFSEPNQNVIRVIRPDRVIERFAGTGSTEYAGDGGPAVQARLGHPRGLEIDSAGNILLADSGFAANAVRRININTNVITTIAGGANPGFSGDGGLASNAQFNNPLHLALDGHGNLYVLDWGNVRIRRIDATSGTITTIAGNGTRGYSGDGGPATKATFDVGVDDFGGLAADADGNLYLADSNNHAVRRIDAASGIITTFFHTDSQPSEFNTTALTTDAAGNVYVAINVRFPTTPRVFKFSPNGQVLQSWGKGAGFSEDGSSAADAHLGNISRIRLERSGNILFAEDNSNRIRRINVSTGLLETLGGMGPHIIGESGSALATTLTDPGTDVLFLPNGDLLTSEGGNYRIRLTDALGNVSDFAGNGFLEFQSTYQGPALQNSFSPLGVGLSPSGDVFVVAGLILRMDISENVHEITSDHGGFSGDGGLAINAWTNQAWGVATDSLGNVFIADTNNNRIRRVDSQSGIITTIAGTGPTNPQEGYGQGTSTGDGGPATAATINTPYAVAVDTDGTIWIQENEITLRKIDPSGIIHSLMRSNTAAISQLRLNAAHNLFFANHRVEPNGHIFKYGLSEGNQGLGDGGPAAQAKWGGIYVQEVGIDTNSEGDIFLSDSSNRRIRAIRFGAVIAEPGSTITVIGDTSQTATTQTKFSVPLEVTLMSPTGTPENGIRVDFSASISGASCKFPNGGSTYSVLTDINGHASVVCTANATAGSYNVTATPLSLTQSVSFSLTNNAAASPPSPIAVNISTRDTVGTANGVMIGGFIIQGSESKSVMIRAIGPSLTQFGVNNALTDPTLELHDSSGAMIATNDNWVATQHGGVITVDQVTNIRNSGLAPTQPYEAAMIVQLQPGAYTAIVGGVKGTAGIGLVEVYDLDSNINSRLANISTRGSVDTGDNVMIGGFIVQGNQSKKVVIRGIGPSLKNFGINNALSDPTLELHDNSGAVIATNNNWQTTQVGGAITGDQMNDIKNSGLAPTDPLEAAMLVTLPPGNYTAIVRGVNGTGIGLVEVYALQ